MLVFLIIFFPQPLKLNYQLRATVPNTAFMSNPSINPGLRRAGHSILTVHLAHLCSLAICFACLPDYTIFLFTFASQMSGNGRNMRIIMDAYKNKTNKWTWISLLSPNKPTSVFSPYPLLFPRVLDLYRPAQIPLITEEILKGQYSEHMCRRQA